MPQATQTFRPAQDVQTKAEAKVDTHDFALNQPPEAADVAQQARQELGPNATGNAPTTYQRHRRSERHQNQEDQQS